MNINGQFYITNYVGQEPLDLMNMPTSFTEDRDQSDYNRFIESVSTIYASQNATGGIPVFWTTRNIVAEAAASTFRYIYSPSEDSTLKSLLPRESYYFILRDNANVPVKIPIVGGASVGFVDEQALVTITEFNDIVLEEPSQNNTKLSPVINDLQPYESYAYEFKGLSANWPVTITPSSGIIKPSNDSTKIDCILQFCATTGICSSSLTALDFDINTKCDIPQDHDLYAVLQLSITPISYSGVQTFSQHVTVSCRDCLPRLSIDIEGSPTTTLTSANGNTYGFVSNISGLALGEQYSYQFLPIRANWPSTMITPMSGTFNTNDSTSRTLASKIIFCPTTGLCPPSDPSVLPYSVGSKFIESYYSSFNLIVTDCNNKISHSEPITVYCDDCL
jgi:hypothetical protein